MIQRLLPLLLLISACQPAAPLEHVVKNGTQGFPAKIVLLDPSDETTVLGEKYFYEDGTLRMEGPVLDGKRHGEWKSYTMQGALLSVNRYKNGAYHGRYENYFPSGNKRIEGDYIDGHEVGEWIIYNASGQREGVYRAFYDSGQLKTKGYFEAGKEVGDWEFYAPDGTVTERKSY